MKKERNKNDQEVTDEKGGETKGKESFYTKDSELKSAFYSNKPMFVLLYKEALFNTNQFDPLLRSSIVSLLQEFENIFLEEISKGLLPI